MGFWSDLCEYVEFAVENPGDAMDDMSGKFGELGDILSEGGKELGEIASDAYMDMTPPLRGPYQL